MSIQEYVRRKEQSDNAKIFEDDFLYSPGQVKKTMNLGQTCFKELIASGTLPFIKISERTRKFRGSTLNRIFCEITK